MDFDILPRRNQLVATITLAITLAACSGQSTQPQDNKAMKPAPANQSDSNAQGKPVVYQVFTRLFGNTNTNNVPWGTVEENGVGKFSDFTDTALTGIKELGTTHIWYTGVPHHAIVADYTEYGISLDDPDVIKGRAGSPYAVKDYYNVNPDLADDPANRLAEFEALIKRTHEHGMKVIIDIVPNHVARQYESLSAPEGVSDFGENDDKTVAYARDNNFYYVVGESFRVPEPKDGYKVLGGHPHPMADGEFDETPAKWTGNGARAAQPDQNDWYETVKVNYGVKPDGSYDFPTLPDDYADKGIEAHAAFWQDKSLPDSWYKFRDIALYWLDKGVDGFRYDMAEMVPVEFWSFLNSAIKMRDPDAFLLAEVYQPHLYRAYLNKGKMDYLYDKVEFYDTLKAIMQGRGNVSDLVAIQQAHGKIAPSMLHFLENHDEQRIASPDFAGDAEKGKPALVVSALISRSPTMLYFGQDVGEDGSEETGFGDPTRTTIFDYAGVPAHQRWMNDGKFDGGQLTEKERSLRAFYIEVMQISATHPAMNGEFASLHASSLNNDSEYSEQQMAFVRYSGDSRLLVVSNFASQTRSLTLTVPDQLASRLALDNSTRFNALLSPDVVATVGEDGRAITLELGPLESAVYEF